MPLLAFGGRLILVHVRTAVSLKQETAALNERIPTLGMLALAQFKSGDVFSRTALRESTRQIADLYSTIGRASADIVPRTEFVAALRDALLPAVESTAGSDRTPATPDNTPATAHDTERTKPIRLCHLDAHDERHGQSPKQR